MLKLKRETLLNNATVAFGFVLLGFLTISFMSWR